MFLPVDHSRQPASEMPPGCTFRASDWQVLAGFWHPVAFEHDVNDKPVGATLLDVPLVVWRSNAGISVAKDLCMHRGTRLSLGRVQDDRLICPMHGLHFDAVGACRRIPSIADSAARIPEKLRLRVYRTTLRYGMVWVCLKDEALWPLPEWPELELPESGYEKVYIPAGEWCAAASREVENFMDVAHHPFVHTRTFGNPGRPEIPRHNVEHTPFGMRLELDRLELERGWHDPGHSGERPTRYRYELTYPFAKDLYTEGREDGIKCHFYDVASPVSATHTRIFQINLTNHLYCSKEAYPRYQIVTNEEDRLCVETQHPEELPLDLRDEVHIPADRFSTEYRRVLAQKFGLGAPLVS